jgi:hypothetical protein
MKLAAPLIIDAHVQTLPTLPGWGEDAGTDRPAVLVSDGALTRRDDVRRSLTVGYVAGDDGPAVHVEPSWRGQGQTREAGSVACSLVVAAADVPAARAAVFDLLTEWAQWLADDPTIGGRLLASSDLTLIADVATPTTRAGASASALVTITYTAVTYG